MNHFKMYLGGTVALLLLVGAGCATTTPTSDTSTPPTDTTNNGSPTDTGEEPAGKEVIAFTRVESTSQGTLDLEFEVSDEWEEKAEAYRLLLTNEPDATWPTEGYWYELGPAHQKKLWIGLPSGKRYARACIVVDNECAVYSASEEVEVK